MDQLYVRYRHEPTPPQHQPEQHDASIPSITLPSENTNGGCDGRPPAASSSSSSSRRSWAVSISLNQNPTTRTTVIRDPFLQDEYVSVFETYLRDSDRPRWSAHNLTAALDEDDDVKGETKTGKRIREYAAALLDQLKLDTEAFTPGATECQVFIVDHPQPGAEEEEEQDEQGYRSGIHCLAWELLEIAEVEGLPKMKLTVTRVTDFMAFPTRPFAVRQQLSTIQADPALCFRILLVVARDFSRTGAERDPEPDLAQWPLMNVQKRLGKARFLLEVVRPGSVEELRAHLAVRDRQGLRFNLVHFDLHGRIGPDSKGRPAPYLLFARHHHHTTTQGGVPQTRLARADTVASLLADYKVENVVLNACLSAYNSTSSATNLAHIFLRHGVRRVSAMWFYVHWQTVSTYLESFYGALLVRGIGFEQAAARGRAAIRNKPGQTFQDFFLCVNYASETPPLTTTARRDPSPSPSTRSQDSAVSSSAGSGKSSFKSSGSKLFKPPMVIAGGGQEIATAFASAALYDGPVMRMKLHFLELEYKLMTSRVVYASNLRRRDQDLAPDVERLISMWLATNLVDDAFYYKGKDFAKRRLSVSVGGGGSGATIISPREKRTRNSPLNSTLTNAGGYLGLLFPPRPVKSLRNALHVIREVDTVVDPGMQADSAINQKAEERRLTAQENLQKFVTRLLGGDEGDDDDDEAGGRNYVLFLGGNDAQWWRTYLQYLGGEWWVSMPWGFTLHSRHRDVRFPGQRAGMGLS